MKVSQKFWMLMVLCFLYAVALIMLQGIVSERSANFIGHTENGLSEYRLVLRSVKYGMLFIVMTFGVFFLFEVLQDLRIHPIQYLLVGAALCLFYLLLLSFAEHIAFRLAYVIAVIACVGLITWYVRYVLQTDQRAWLMGGLLLAGYVILFVLLQSAAYTLLVGSLLLFVALASVMYLTRHVDWYAIPTSAEIANDLNEST